MKILNELYYYCRKKGIKNTIKRIIIRYAHILKFRIHEINLGEDLNYIWLDPDFNVIIDDLCALEKIREGRENLPREFYIDKTHDGKKFFLFLLNSEPVFIQWVFGKGEYSRFIDIQDKKFVELQYAYTIPKFRGRRILSKAVNYTCRELLRQGYAKVFIVISEGNVDCIRAMKFTCFKTVGTVISYFSLVKRVKV